MCMYMYENIRIYQQYSVCSTQKFVAQTVKPSTLSPDPRQSTAWISPARHSTNTWKLSSSS